MNLTQKVRPAYWDDMERQLQAIFYQIIFEPIVEVLEKTTAQMSAARLENVRRDPGADHAVIRAALRTGRVQYNDGVFSGQFSGQIATGLRQMGATFIKRQGIYKLNPAAVPGWVKAESGVYKTTAREANAQIRKALDYVDSSLDQMVDTHTVRAHKTVAGFEKDFQPIAKRIEVHPTLSQESIDKLSEEYTQNMKLWIQKFSEEEIEELRGIVEANAQEGYRFDSLISKIQGRYGVARSKAKFLARQETALFMSKFRQNRFKEAGVTSYTWSTAQDERVRSDHKHLNGRIFLYSQPPVVDRATDRTGNPGEDFNCRCVDIPILKPVAVAA